MKKGFPIGSCKIICKNGKKFNHKFKNPKNFENEIQREIYISNTRSNFNKNSRNKK